MSETRKITAPQTNELLALHIIGASSETSSKFFSPADDSLQIGVHHWDSPKTIKPHSHARKRHTVPNYQEALIILSGSVTASFHSDDGKILAEVKASGGDILVIYNCVHSFKSDDKQTKIIEIKQGPYEDFRQ